MAISHMNRVIDHLRKLARDGVETTDGQLLECFVSRGEEAALEALVLRHGPMVWGVCRRLLPNHHDAEDAFQATFLVLVRKAAAIVPREMVGNWLYGVAHQTAWHARTRLAKQRTREVQVTAMPEPSVIEQDLGRELQPILDRELSRLPDKYRVAIVLCDLEGKTRREAAQQLGLPDGTLASRLARGRALLAKRLTRHGLAGSGGMLAMVLSQQAAGSVPAPLLSSTIKAVTLVAAGSAVTAGMISAKVAALAEGVLKNMLFTKLKVILVLLTVAVVTIGAISVACWTASAQDAKAPAPPKSKVARLQRRLPRPAPGRRRRTNWPFRAPGRW
jgi:RNA polymerase sigma factor (sigma-70 family)